MGTDCAPPDAYLFCLVMRETSCCLFLTIIKLKLVKHLTLPRYLGDLLYIDNPHFEHMVVRGFEPHRRHCVVVLEQDTFILA